MLLHSCVIVTASCLPLAVSVEDPTPAAACQHDTMPEANEHEPRRRALEWVQSLRDASLVELDQYVSETQQGSGVVLHQCLRATYEPYGFLLETWTPEQHDRGAWTVDERRSVIGDEPPVHTVRLTGDEVHETVRSDVDSPATQSFRYSRLDPLKEELAAMVKRVAEREAKEQGLAMDAWPAYIERRQNEELPRLLKDAETGVPITRARRHAPCLSGCTFAGYLGDTDSVDTFEGFIASGVWLEGTSVVDGSECHRVITEGPSHTHTLYIDERGAVVRWTTTVYEDGALPVPQNIRVVRERTFRFEVTPGAGDTVAGQDRVASPSE